MNAKVQYLFDRDKLLARPTPEQSEFERHNYDFLKKMVEFTYSAFETTRREAAAKDDLSMNFAWFATTMNGNVLSEIGKEFRNCIKATGRKNHSISLEPNYECYIKKLTDGALLPCYNHSETTSAMCEMMALPEQNPLPVLFIGYTLGRDNTEVTGCYAVCIKGRERLWVTDLSSLRPPMFGNNIVNTPVDLPDLDVKIKVKEIKEAK